MKKSQCLEVRFARQPSFVGREVAGEFILVPIIRRSEDVDCIYNLNEVGALIWQLLDGQRTAAEIGEQIVSEFEVDPARAEADLLELLQQLESVGAITPV
ncbi:MAG: hypothetical protein C0617_07370 [Desulfuromonas sp.]|uniref:PqqD family protein n=1 Tax=Desulfuromonas sp. TaxID=892 RepID=UPI000CBF9E2D|nr:PqqD family protein [Desulfuromonas sp.]PLX84651.1 MAG: hypothetical protein C0617_07370 [Desulfuromonas sp.]